MNKRHPSSPKHRRSPASPRITHWGEVADWYDQLVGDAGSEYHREVIIPGVLRLLGLKADHSGARSAESPGADKALSVVDLACGQGVLCRKLAALGCAVVGIDSAQPLIAAANQRNAAEGLAIEYAVADATKLLDAAGKLPAGLRADAADAVTIILAVQNMTPLSPLWQGCRTLLKPGGRLVIVMMHPCFRVPRMSDWHWDNEAHAQSRLVRQYLTSASIPIQTHPGLAAHGKDAAATTHFHRPLQAYINTLGNAGLLVDHIEEWVSHKKSQPGPRQKALDQARKEIPLFLALRARKA